MHKIHGTAGSPAGPYVRSHAPALKLLNGL